MFKCELCGQEMPKTDGCLCTKIKYNGHIYNRIRFGEEFDLYAGSVNEDDRCPDCGVKPGFCHHYGCGVENHPVTHLQMLDYEVEFVK